MATIFIQDEETGTEVRIDNVDVTIHRENELEDEFGLIDFRRSWVTRRYYWLEVGKFEGYQMATPRRIGQHRKEVD